MIKKWNQFIREFVNNPDSLIDAKMQELKDLVDSVSDGQNMVYEWENKKDHQLSVSFSTGELSIKYEFDIDDLYITKTAGDVIDFQTNVESMDEGLDMIEKDIQGILGISENNKYKNMKYLKKFESYTFEDFTHVDMEDVKDLLEEGLSPEEIAIELDFSLDKVKQIIYSLKKNENFQHDENKIHIPIEYSGVIMELGEEVDPNDIISLYNEIVEEGTPLVSYSQYGTEGKFYNEDDDEIPTDVILDELNYAIGLEDLDEAFLIPKPVRKFNPFWKDEDIALEVLRELKSLRGNLEGIAKLLISEVRGYSFIVDGFKFHVTYLSIGPTLSHAEMKMNDKYMKVSTEVCKQIFNLVEQLKNTDFIEQEEDDKKDFRINRGLM